MRRRSKAECRRVGLRASATALPVSRAKSRDLGFGTLERGLSASLETRRDFDPVKSCVSRCSQRATTEPELGNVCTVRKSWMVTTGEPQGLMCRGWDTPFHSMQVGADLGDHQQLVVGFALGGRIDPNELPAIESAVRDYASEATVVAAVSHDWTNDPWSRGAWMSEPPLWVVDGILDLLATPHGRIIMAGADIAAVYPGWITSAINSGHVAAREAEQLLGVPVG